MNGHTTIPDAPLEQTILAIVEQDLAELLAFFKQTPGYWYVIGLGGKHMIVETNRPLR